MYKKTIKYLVYSSLLVLVSSCSFLGDNIDPHKVSEEQITPEALLATCIEATSQNHYTIAFTTNQITQHTALIRETEVTDIADRHQTIRLSESWRGIYKTLANCEEMEKLAIKNSKPYYEGIAKILKAINLGLATDHWESIPYSEAFQGADNLTPAYDTQEEIYISLLSLLDQAISKLEIQKTNTISAEDLIYQGNIDQWIKVANTLKIRYTLHLNTNTPNNVLSLIDNLQANIFSSYLDDFQLIYNTKNLNPWHIKPALANKTGNFTITHGQQLINYMNGTIYPFTNISQDPRLPLIAESSDNDTYMGATNGNGEQEPGNTIISENTWYAQANAPIVMISFAELKFIEAEVTLNSNPARAYDAYLGGIEAHMKKLEVSESNINEYINDPSIAVGANNLTLDLIMREKYISLFLNPEAWNDLRRYNESSDIFKNLTLPQNHNPELNNQWIKRALYPLEEFNRNATSAQAASKSLSEALWWNKL